MDVDTGGGYLLREDQKSSRGRHDLDRSTPAPSFVRTAPLNAKQESRLRDHLELTLLDISRRWAKRHTPASDVRTLPAYLATFSSLLPILAAIPPVGASTTSLLLSFTLRVTSELTEGIIGYELHPHQETLSADSATHLTSGETAQKDETDTQQLNAALTLLYLLDSLWNALLHGEMLNLSATELQAKSHYADQDEAAASGFPFTPLVPPSPAAKAPSTSFVLPGSVGSKTVDPTFRVRLRNVIIASKENLFVWMRRELDGVEPPRIQDNEEAKLQVDFGWMSRGSTVNETDTEAIATAEDTDMEDVNILDARASLDQNATGREQVANEQESDHYKALFEKKLDPDESDSDTEIPAGAYETFQRQSKSTALLKSASSASPFGASTTDSMGGTDRHSPSLPGRSHTSILRWDREFSRLFSKTLKAIRDISDPD